MFAEEWTSKTSHHLLFTIKESHLEFLHRKREIRRGNILEKTKFSHVVSVLWENAR